MNKNKISNCIISKIKNNEYIKKRYKKLTKKLNTEEKELYNLIKLSILIENLLVGLKAVKIYNANNAGTGFIFKLIEDEEDFQLEANTLIKMFEEMR